MSPTGNVPLYRPACRWIAIFFTSFISEMVKLRCLEPKNSSPQPIIRKPRLTQIGVVIRPKSVFDKITSIAVDSSPL